jgi:dTMP kinase
MAACNGVMVAAAETVHGRFVTFEGGEGAGKSTQARELSRRLAARGLSTVLTREPGGAPGAEEIRELLITGDKDKWTPFTETLLHITARHEHVARTIRPALEDGAWVISDRFLHSTIAYQGYGLGQDRDVIAALHQIVLQGFAPDLTLVLDLDVEKGIERALGRGDGNRYETMDIDFHRRVRDGFREMAAGSPNRIVLVDADADIETIAARVWDAVAAAFADLPAKTV